MSRSRLVLEVEMDTTATTPRLSAEDIAAAMRAGLEYGMSMRNVVITVVESQLNYTEAWRAESQAQADSRN